MKKVLFSLILSLIPTIALADGQIDISQQMSVATATSLTYSTVEVIRHDGGGTGVVVYNSIREGEHRIRDVYIVTNKHVVGKSKSVIILN